MSEPAPESPPASSGGSAFTRKFGPLPLWGWMAVGLALALIYYFWRQNQANQAANSASSASTGTVDTSQVPQFVNQTVVQPTPPTEPTVTPPSKPGSPPPAQPPIAKQLGLDRSWTAPNGTQTLDQIGKALKIYSPATEMHPANAEAKTFMSSVYPKNHNAKVPKGAQFTYIAGS